MKNRAAGAGQGIQVKGKAGIVCSRDCERADNAKINETRGLGCVWLWWRCGASAMYVCLRWVYIGRQARISSLSIEYRV